MQAITLWLQQYMPRETLERLVSESDGFGVGRDELRAELPTNAQTLADYYHRVVLLLDAHGLLDGIEFYAAIVRSRPNRARELEHLARLRGVELPKLAGRLATVTAVGMAVAGTRGGVVGVRLLAVLAAAHLVVGGVQTLRDIQQPSDCPVLMPVPDSPGNILAPAETPDRLESVPAPTVLATTATAAAVDDETIIYDEPLTPRRPRAHKQALPAAQPARFTPSAVVEPIDRCGGQVEDMLAKKLPDFTRQRSASGDPTDEIRLLLDVAGDGRTTQVSSDKVWGALNRGVLGSIRAMDFGTSNVDSKRCVCKIDFTNGRTDCKDHTMSSRR